MPQLAEKTAPRLFISYSHDSAEHEDRVLALAARLRVDGIDALIDKYDTAPPDGWPMWMAREIQKADFVAMVCTETYLQRVEGRELPGKGRGVLWEAKLIYNTVYPEDSKVQRFIPVLFADGQSSYIPLPIRGSTYYQVDSADGYEDFYRHLTGQPRHEKPAVGKLKALPAIAPQSYPASLEMRSEPRTSTQGASPVVHLPQRPPLVIGREQEIGELRHRLQEPGSVAYVSGLPGRGKTTLALEYAHRYQREFEAVHWLPCRGRTLVQMAGELAWQLGLKLDGELDAIIRQLTGHCASKRCLLVLDNVEDDTSARLMPAGRTSVLITTRLISLRFLRGYRPLNLPLFTEEQSFELFREVIGKEEVERH